MGFRIDQGGQAVEERLLRQSVGFGPENSVESGSTTMSRQVILDRLNAKAPGQKEYGVRVLAVCGRWGPLGHGK